MFSFTLLFVVLKMRDWGEACFEIKKFAMKKNIVNPLLSPPPQLFNKPSPSNKHPPPPHFRERKLISRPLPSPNYFSLRNDRLYKSITTVKLRVHRSWMVYELTGSSDVIPIPGFMT